jgi:hypothetical protein
MLPRVRNGAVLRELIYLRTKRLQNTGIAEAILKLYEMNIRFIYMKYDVDLHHVVPKMFQTCVRKGGRMT